jgi:tetratricopeptide (TPR) repeat protein
VNGTESWSYLTESDLRIQLSKVPGTNGRYEHEWGALRAAAQAVSRMPAWARAWLALADAAMTRHLYRVAEAAAERAYEIEDNEATRASYVQALINVGRYEDALRQLGNQGDAWRQCSRGFIALRLDRPEEAIRHFAGVKIDPTWIWAWHSSICALVSIGDLASARRKSEEFMYAIADREGERSWLSAAAFDARLHGRLDDARMHARSLLKVAGPNNGRALHAMGEAQILGKDPAGWELLVRAIAQDPRPTSIDAWEREDRPILAALAAERGFTLESLKPPPAIMHPDARPHVSDPVAELRAAAAAMVLPEAAEAARLTEAALQARERQDSQAAEARGTRSSDGKVSASDRPPLRLRLPASWFAASTDSGHEDRPRLHYLPELPELLWWAGPEVELSGSDELEPDGYQILAGDTIYASGHVDPRRRYCRRDTLSLLPEAVRTSPRIDTTDQDARIPSDLLDSSDTLAELLTRSAAEMIAEHYYEVAQKLGPAPPPIPPPPPVYQPLTTDRLAYRRWELRRRPLGDDWEDWIGAERLRQQLIREAAYFLWVNRDRWQGDDWADWFASEREITGNKTQPSPLPGSVVDECLRQQLEEEAELYRWLVFVQTVRHTAESGHLAELRVSAGGRSCPRPLSPPPGP